MILERTLRIGRLELHGSAGAITLPIAGPRYMKLYVVRPEAIEFEHVELRANGGKSFHHIWHQTTELLLRDAGCVRENGRLVEIKFDPIDSACVTQLTLEIHAPTTAARAPIALEVWAEVQTPMVRA